MKTLPLLVLAVFITASAPAQEPITFDEFPPELGNHALITNGYGGLQWHNFGAFNGSIRPPNEGYHTGVISPSNVAFNLFGDPAWFFSGTPFTLKSAYLTSAFVTNLHVTVVGWNNSTIVYSNVYTLQTTGPAFITFDYTNVDRVTFTASPATQFAMDNLLVLNAGPIDSDGDGVPDDQDECPNTPPGSIVDAHGCSLEQLVPCEGPASGGKWKNHGEFVTAMTRAADAFLAANLITAAERAAVIRAAATSDCGKK